jgi:hypothetical protein
MIPKTTPRNSFPGDAARLLLEDAADTAGRLWRKGEAISILSSGQDNAKGCRYMQTVNGARFESE